MQAVKNNDNLDQSTLLGYMIFYYIPDIKISHADFEQIFDNNSMDKKCLPPKIYEHDAFRRATGKVKGTISVDLGGNYSDAKLNIDEVVNDQNQVVRILGRKVIDSANAEVSYEPAGKFYFDKGNKSASFSVNQTFASEYDYNKLMEGTIDLFKEWTNYHSKDTVRNIVNKIVKSTQPVTIIKGAYFIPKNEYDIIKGLQGVIKDLAQFTSNETPGIEVIPLIDTVEQRNMISTKANTELMGDIDTLVTELSEMLIDTNKEIHKRTINRIACQFQELRSKKETYSTLLETKMGVVEQQLLSAIDKFSHIQAKHAEETEYDENLD